MNRKPEPTTEGATRTFVVQPVFRFSRYSRTPQAIVEEGIGLAQAIQLDVCGSRICQLTSATPAFLIGKGQAEEIAQFCQDNEVTLVFVNHPLSPPQQRNLERACNAKVIDRTGLILEIFGARAQTAEGQLQVELAALSYQRSRLVRSWTHLERQRGGFGFLGGPGESQLEIDRRLISQRILKIKQELEDVRRTRGLHRKAREKAEYPVLALVGYTNAGKSTLFNRLTGEGVLVKDMLFATLDPTMRQFKLPSGREVILSDTVGFISDLPTHLVEAFRATLEEVENADIILHVRDVSHEDTRAQKEDVLNVLNSLGIENSDPRIVEVLNKTDLLPEEERNITHRHAGQLSQDSLLSWAFQGIQEGVKGGTVALSALTGEGMDQLFHLLNERLKLGEETRTLKLDYNEGSSLAWLYEHGEVVSRDDGPKYMTLEVRLSPANWGRYQTRSKMRKKK